MEFSCWLSTRSGRVLCSIHAIKFITNNRNSEVIYNIHWTFLKIRHLILYGRVRSINRLWLKSHNCLSTRKQMIGNIRLRPTLVFAYLLWIKIYKLYKQYMLDSIFYTGVHRRGILEWWRANATLRWRSVHHKFIWIMQVLYKKLFYISRSIISDNQSVSQSFSKSNELRYHHIRQ